MAISKGLCQKSAAESKLKPFDIKEVCHIFDSNSDQSSSLKEIYSSYDKIGFVISKRTPLFLTNEILSTFSDKIERIFISEEFSIYSDPACKCDLSFIPQEYREKVYMIDKSDTNDFDYYGAGNARIPMLLHKSINSCDAFIIVSDVLYDNRFGYSGGAVSFFYTFAHDKSIKSLLMKSFDALAKDKLSTCGAGLVKDNPLASACKEAVVLASARVDFFGINFINNNEGGISYLSCGDLLLDHIKTQKVFDEDYVVKINNTFDAIELYSEAESLFELTDELERASKGVVKGGRVFIEAPNLKYFGSSNYRDTFNICDLSDIYDKLNNSNDYLELVYAFDLKKICLRYNIGIVSNFEDGLLRQIGLNIYNIDDKLSFLHNCKQIGKLYNAARFTIKQDDTYC